jgi:anti-sigma factor RsiW
MTFLTRDLACQQAVELVTDYLEGRLSRRHRKRFERHLAGCPNCSAYLDQIRQTINLTGQMTPESLEPAARDELIDLFRKYTRDPDQAD